MNSRAGYITPRCSNRELIRVEPRFYVYGHCDSTQNFRTTLFRMRIDVVASVLLPDDNVLQHIVNYLRGNVDEKHLSRQNNAFETVRCWWEKIN